jgi:nucleotidyltransferase/DNA polymerase involved in DNA repair
MRKATTLIIEPLSLDEAYLDVTENLILFAAQQLEKSPVCRGRTLRVRRTAQASSPASRLDPALADEGI